MVNVTFDFNADFYVVYENCVYKFKITIVNIREDDKASLFSGYILNPEAPNEEDAKTHIYDVEDTDVFTIKDDAEKELIKRTLSTLKERWFSNKTISKLFQKHYKGDPVFPVIEGDKVLYEHK